jgi:molybdopterin-containing oxidoreductase family membrane subunit
VDYTPTLVELAISFGIYSIGALVLTILFKIAVGVKREAV